MKSLVNIPLIQKDCSSPGSSPNNVDDISRYPMKNRLVWGLRDRIEPVVA